jgi:hypothetical protein
LLLKVDYNVNGTVKLGRHIVVRMIAGVLAARSAPCVSIIASAKDGGFDLARGPESSGELFDTA